MKRFLLIAACLICSVSHADDFTVANEPLGSGVPVTVGGQTATFQYDGMYSIAQYMPGLPTASVIWPRVIDVQCVRESDKVACEGFNWLPTLGRGEYLFVRPHIVERTTPVERVVEKTVLIEVPVKRKRE